MICPYCDRAIHGWTGLQEAQKFQRHLGRCRKNPNNIVLRDGTKTGIAIVPKRPQSFLEALEIRNESGQ